MITTKEILEKAKAVSATAPLCTDDKNRALRAMANALIENTDSILEANALDVAAAEGTVSSVMIDRLRLDKSRIEGMANGILEVADLPDPVGAVCETSTHKNGLLIEKTSVPFGVVAIIYESRPNVTVDAAALGVKVAQEIVAPPLEDMERDMEDAPLAPLPARLAVRRKAKPKFKRGRYIK